MKVSDVKSVRKEMINMTSLKIEFKNISRRRHQGCISDLHYYNRRETFHEDLENTKKKKRTFVKILV